MKLYRFGTCLFVLCVVLLFAQQASAQQYEFYGYGGGVWPGSYRDQFDLKRQAVWGGKFLGYLSDRVGIEGNVGYLNHFEFDLTDVDVDLDAFDAIDVDLDGDIDFDVRDPKSRGVIWEVNTNLNFFGARGSVADFAPFLTFGVGGITALIPDENPLLDGRKTAVILPSNHPIAVTPIEIQEEIFDETPVFPSATALVVDNGDTFFAFNYGGGFKQNNVWGPMGLRVDFQGRTMPNFFGNALSWFEMTGGVNFSWGER